LVERYYHSLNWTRSADVRKFLAVVEGLVAELDALVKESPGTATSAEAEKSRMLSSLARDGYAFDGVQFLVTATHSHLDAISVSTAALDAPELHRQLERLRSSVETDPALTLGTAKELVETVCKTILEERGKHPAPDWDVGRLVKETREVLKLLPTDIPDAVKGADAIRRLLSNLGAVAQGLGELRNLYGTGHGKSGKRRGIEPRHARLASGAAAALVTFLLDTHWERDQ